MCFVWGALVGWGDPLSSDFSRQMAGPVIVPWGIVNSVGHWGMRGGGSEGAGPPRPSPGGRGGGHSLFKFVYQLQNYTPPPYFDKGQPLIQIYIPLFSLISKNSPSKSALSGEFSVLHISYYTKMYCFVRFKNKSRCIYLLCDVEYCMQRL